MRFTSKLQLERSLFGRYHVVPNLCTQRLSIFEFCFGYLRGFVMAIFEFCFGYLRGFLVVTCVALSWLFLSFVLVTQFAGFTYLRVFVVYWYFILWASLAVQLHESLVAVSPSTFEGDRRALVRS